MLELIFNTIRDMSNKPWICIFNPDDPTLKEDKL